MNAIDLDVRIESEKVLPSFLEMAQTLGYSGIASSISFDVMNIESVPLVYRRINLTTTKLSSLKKKATNARVHNHIVTIPVRGVDTANWAAEDPRIDILTLDPTGKNTLRKTTANLSAKHDTALEVCIAPLLGINGLERSKMIRNYHNAIHIATRAGMMIVLSSGANIPIHMRSPVALRHIAMTLGMDRHTADDAITLNPKTILDRSTNLMNGNRTGLGIEIIKGDEA